MHSLVLISCSIKINVLLAFLSCLPEDNGCHMYFFFNVCTERERERERERQRERERERERERDTDRDRHTNIHTHRERQIIKG